MIGIDNKTKVEKFFKIIEKYPLNYGWVASSKKVIDKLRDNRDYTMICNGMINDELAIHTLKNKEKILERNRKIIAENLEILKKWVDKEPKVSAVLPNYVSTSSIKLDIEMDNETFVRDCLMKKGYLLYRGTFLG